MGAAPKIPPGTRGPEPGYTHTCTRTHTCTHLHTHVHAHTHVCARTTQRRLPQSKGECFLAPLGQAEQRVRSETWGLKVATWLKSWVNPQKLGWGGAGRGWAGSSLSPAAVGRGQASGCSRDQDSLFNCANLLLDMKQVTYVAQTPASQGVKRRSEPDLCSVLCAQARTAQAGGRRGFRGYKVLTGVWKSPTSSSEKVGAFHPHRDAHVRFLTEGAQILWFKKKKMVRSTWETEIQSISRPLSFQF